jgi:hypothetical protein
MPNKKKTDYLGILMGVLVFIAVGTRYADYVWAKNSLLTLYAPCDMASESCFISDEENSWVDLQLEPYKKITVIEKYAPYCLQEHTCERFSCDEVPSCQQILCSVDNLESGEQCTSSEPATSTPTSTE